VERTLIKFVCSRRKISRKDAYRGVSESAQLRKGGACEPMIIIDYKDRRPIYEQVVERFEELILKGVLEPGSQLPSVRNLAMELSINPNTIQRAYMELERRRFIYSVKGKGSFIADNENLIDIKKEEMLEKIINVIKEARNMGISKEKIIGKVNEGYI
jgi:GntR family transcriptional regulator